MFCDNEARDIRSPKPNILNVAIVQKAILSPNLSDNNQICAYSFAFPLSHPQDQTIMQVSKPHYSESTDTKKSRPFHQCYTIGAKMTEGERREQ